MQPRTLRLTDPVEALVVEQALALVRQLREACQNGPHGHVLAQAELVALDQGRVLTLQAVLNDAAAPAEKKGHRSVPVSAERPAKVKGKPSGRP
jgi:hypothetical protein